MTGPIRLMGIGAAALEWSADALCAQTDPEVFFPEVSEDPAAAVAVCRKCPVRQECLDYAIAAREQHGVWGGHTENELRRLAGPAPDMSCPSCGREFRQRGALAVHAHYCAA